MRETIFKIIELLQLLVKLWTKFTTINNWQFHVFMVFSQKHTKFKPKIQTFYKLKKELKFFIKNIQKLFLHILTY